MELKEFVKTTLLQITEALAEANTTSKASHIHFGIFGTAEHQGIEFDVALTAEDTGRAEGSGSLKVAAMMFGGVEGEACVEGTAKRAEVSRIRFRVSAHSTTKAAPVRIPIL